MTALCKIYIIGFMGSGKSTAGRKLASDLEWSFIDLDRKIEEYTVMKIPEIFSVHGEEYFREVEARVLKNLEPETNTVVSTGGGTPCFGDNMSHMLRTGLTIYLKMTPEQLKNRLSRSSAERPLLKNISNDKLQDYIEEKLAEREHWYNRAEIIIDGLYGDSTFLLSVVKKSILH
ncbi:MAG TPA: shikimate kinase [Bacteroidales bacterium]|nr:shikimate kinase [Bacteroidales bacterium]